MLLPLNCRYCRQYKDMGGYTEVRTIFSTILDEYGVQKKKMTLVLFEAALEHLCRVHRIIRNPRGTRSMDYCDPLIKVSMYFMLTCICSLMYFHAYSYLLSYTVLSECHIFSVNIIFFIEYYIPYLKSPPRHFTRCLQIKKVNEQYSSTII